MMIRKSWLVAFAGLVIAGAACKKDDDKKNEPTPAGDKATEDNGSKDKPKSDDQAMKQDNASKPDPSPAAAPKPITGAIADDLSLLPADSDVVMGINFAQLQSSALWKEFVAPKLANGAPGIDKFKAMCGFDPLADLKSVAIGVKQPSDSDAPQGAVAVHGWDRKKASACFDKNMGDCEKDGSKCSVDGEVAFVTTKDGKHVAFTFVNDSTALMVIGPDAETKDKVQAVASGKTALKTSNTFVELYNKINTNDSLWMVLNGNAPMMKKTPMPVKMKALFGSVNVTDGLAVDFRARLGSPDEASNIVSTYKGKLSDPMMKQMVTKLDLTSEGPDVRLSLAMTGDQLKQVAMLLGSMMGGMGRGGGGMMGGGMGGP